MEYYDGIAQGYNELYGEEQRSKARTVQKILCIGPDETVLDVGCGTGLATLELGGKKTGVEPARVLSKQASFPVVHARAEQLPFKDKSFDVVVCLTAIHHCDANKALLEMKRVARQKIAVSVLKKAKNFGAIVAAMRAAFGNVDEQEMEKDVLFTAKLK